MQVDLKDDTGKITGSQLISASAVNKSGINMHTDAGHGKNFRITQYRAESDPQHGNLPPSVLIPKGMGLNMCEYEQFNSSLSSADPTEIDCYHNHKRYDIARSRSCSISIGEDEDEERDSSDERDVNEILDYTGVYDGEESSGNDREAAGRRVGDSQADDPSYQL